MELDRLDRISGDAFDGFIVRKDLVRTFARQYPVPTYVCEFLLGRYCSSIDEEEIQEGLQIVERQLRDRAVPSGEQAKRPSVLDPRHSADPTLEAGRSLNAALRWWR